LTHAEVQALALRLQQQIVEALHECTSGVAMGPDVTVNVVNLGGRLSCTFWDQPYHTLLQGGAMEVSLECKAPVHAKAVATPYIGLALDEKAPFAFIVIDANRNDGDSLLLRIHDVYPSFTSAAESFIQSWVRRRISLAMKDLHAGIAASLKQTGF
jgi:hypothetical protein